MSLHLGVYAVRMEHRAILELGKRSPKDIYATWGNRPGLTGKVKQRVVRKIQTEA